MKTEKIIDLGSKLGLPFSRESNFPFQLDENFVVFDGCNGQRFAINGNKLSDAEVYREFGKALILYGKRLKCLEINNALSITGDH